MKPMIKHPQGNIILLWKIIFRHLKCYMKLVREIKENTIGDIT